MASSRWIVKGTPAQPLTILPSGGEAVPVGTVVQWDENDPIPPGYLAANGSAFDPAAFPELAAVYEDNRTPVPMRVDRWWAGTPWPPNVTTPKDGAQWLFGDHQNVPGMGLVIPVEPFDRLVTLEMVVYASAACLIQTFVGDTLVHTFTPTTGGSLPVSFARLVAANAAEVWNSRVFANSVDVNIWPDPSTNVAWMTATPWASIAPAR